MILSSFARRTLTPLFVIFCFLCIASQSAQAQSTTSNPITLVDGNTTCFNCPAVQPVGLVPGVGAVTPAPPVLFSGLPVTLSGVTYGGVNNPKFGGGNGGFTGWMHITYTVPPGTPTNSYILQFLVSNAGDTSLATALAIDNIMSPGLTESFENGIPATWTLSGGAAGFTGPTGGTSPAITNLAPTNGSFFAWITAGCSGTFNCNNTLGSVPTSYGSLYQGPGTNGLPALTNGVPPPQALGSPTFGTTLQSPPFALAALDTISFDVNFGTNDGTYDFSDFFFGQLIPTLTGTPISATQMQTFVFNNAANNVDVYSFDYSNAFNAGTITANATATPIINNFQITPSDWASRVAGTWAATTQCIAIAGANNNCGQKRQVCTTTGNSTPLGSNCAQSSERNILLTSTFDPVTPITDPNTVFGVVEFNDTGSCPFDGLAANFPCPDNGLVFLKGPGQHRGGKGAGITNSNIAIVTGVLPPVTATTGFVNAAGWTNTNNATPVTGTLTANPPANPNINGSVIAPIDSISYGTSQGGLPATFPPISTDTTVFCPQPPNNSTPSTCLASITASTCPSTITATTPASPSSTSVNLGTLAEGTWLLHYQARDCAGTNELKFTRDSSGNWSTNFQSLTINVDNTAPTVSANVTGASVLNSGTAGPTLNFGCADSLSGLQICGTSQTSGLPTGCTLGSASCSGSNGPLSTTTIGTNHVTVYAQDQAGNKASKIANYSVLYSSTGSCVGDPGRQILPPISPNGTTVFPKGVIVPARFRVCDGNGVSIGTPGVITNITVQIKKGNTTDSDAAADAAALLAATIFHFDTTHQFWFCNIATSGLDSGYTYAFTLTLNDGSTLSFKFGVK